MGVNRKTFDFILNQIAHLRHRKPSYIAPKPIEGQCQLTLKTHRLEHGCSFKVIINMFEVSQSLATEIFINNNKCMVLNLYAEFVFFQEQKQTGQTNVKIS